MPNRLIIIRHGETGHNKAKILQGHLDIPLNDTGRAQADNAAKILKDEKFDVVFSSDLQRAHETARRALGDKKTDQIHLTPLLRERYFGKFQGMTFSQIGNYLTKFGEQGNFSFQGREKEFGVETEEELKARIAAFMKNLESHKGRNVAVFSHGGFIKRLLQHLGVLGKDDNPYIPNATPIVLIKKGNTYVVEE